MRKKIITKDETKNLNKFGLLKLDYLKKKIIKFYIKD